MRTPLDVLKPGSCETLKAGVHGMALGLIAVMGLYNAAAWLRRRETHLAVNAVIYGTLTIWERRLVAHHLAERRRTRDLEREMRTDPPANEPKPTRVAA
jgi:hypothetical protein